MDKAASVSNYFIGNDPSRWRSGVPSYDKVRAAGVYPGIDVVYHGHERKLEYDFVVAPGADPGRIRLSFEGADKLTIDAAGNLLISTRLGDITHHKPLAYQEINGERRRVPAAYSIRHGAVELALGNWDRERVLVIDPTLDYSTFLGGSSDDFGTAIAVPPAMTGNPGDVYVTGYTASTDFPVGSAVQPTKGGSFDAFVAKLNTSGSGTAGRIYITYLGGNGDDRATGIAVGASGAVYVVGRTGSSGLLGGFPTTSNAFQADNSGRSDLFITKLAPGGGSLLYSTYLGGRNDDGSDDNYPPDDSFATQAIAIEADRYAYITSVTKSNDFPAKNGMELKTFFEGNTAALVSKLDTQGSGSASLVYSTLLGGSGADRGYGIAVGATGIVYVTGSTTGSFPIRSASQQVFAGRNDAFVAKLNTNLSGDSSLIYSTYLGGENSDKGLAIAVDSAGSAYVTGQTNSPGLGTPGAFQPFFLGIGDSPDAFVAKLNPFGFLQYFTYFGGFNDDHGLAIAVNDAFEVYVAGSTESNTLPLQDPLYRYQGGWEAFVMKLNSSGTALLFSTYLGSRSGSGGNDYGRGIAINSDGIYVTGWTNKGSFPTTPSAFQPAYGGANDAFISRIALAPATPASITVAGGNNQQTSVKTAFTVPLEVQVTDSLGRPLAEIPVTFQAPATGASATLSSFTATTDGTGHASVQAVANSIAGGPYTVTASVAGVTTPATFSLTNTAGAAQKIAFVQQPGDTAAGSPITPAVTVSLKDAFDNPIPNASITMSVQGGAPPLQGTLARTTDSLGMATFNDLKITKAGTYRLQATGGGLTATSGNFVIRAGSTISITPVIGGGGGQSATAGTAYASPLRAVVQDNFNNPVQGASVTFTAPSTGATVTFGGSATANTDINGVAVSPTMTASGQTGTFSVNATTSGAPSPAAFSLTIIAGAANKLGFVQQPSNSAADTPITPPVTVQLQDSFGNPVRTEGVSIALQLVPVNARIRASSVIPPQMTGPSGLATFAALTVQHVGQYQLMASSTGVSSAVSTPFIIRAGPAATIMAASGTPQSTIILMPFSQPLQATVSDAFGNPVSNVVVSFSAPNAGASATLSAATATTDASGNASVTATANGMAGGYAVSASAGAVGPTTFALTNLVGAAGQITYAQQPSNTAAGSTISPAVTVQVVDAGGNPVNGASVTLQLQGGTGTLGGTATRTTGSDGMALFNDLTVNTVGTYRLNATSGGASALSNSFDITPAAAITVTIADGDGQTAPVDTAYALPLKASVQDAFGNPIPNAQVTFAARTGGASVTFAGPTDVVTDASGIALSPLMKANTVVGSVSVTASTAGAPSPVTFVLNNVAGNANKLEFLQQPRDSAAGAAITPPVTVQLQDSFGNPVRTAGVHVTLQLNLVEGRLRRARAIEPQDTDSNGVATFASLSIEQAGRYTLSALASGITSAISNQFNITASPGPGSTIVATGVTTQSTTILTPFSQPLQAMVQDAYGNPLSGVSVTFSAPAISAPSATLSPGSVVTDSSGHAMVTATANGLTGTYPVTAAATSITGSTATYSLTNVAAAAAGITFVRQPSNTQAGVYISPPVVVRLTDAQNNGVSGAEITMRLPAGVTLGGTVQATTSAAGEATFDDLSVNTTGSYQLIAESGSTSAVSNPFQVTPALASLVISVYEGDRQTAITGTAYGAPLKAAVRDLYGNPMSGIPVTFTAPPSGASLSFAGTATVNTDLSGMATSPSMTANTTAGAVVVKADAPNAAGLAEFTLTNVLPSANKLAFQQQPTDTMAGATIAPPVTVQLQDVSDKPVHTGGVTVTLQANVPAMRSKTFSGNTTRTTDASGLATFDGLSGSRAGTYELQANANGVASATSGTFMIKAGTPASIAATGGTPQGAIINTVFGAPLQVTVSDAAGNPIAGVPVVFNAPTLGASGLFGGQLTVTVNTDTSGNASAIITANNTAGSYAVTASSAAITGSALFNLTNLPAGAGSLAFVQQPSNVEIGTVIEPAVTVQVLDSLAKTMRVAGVPIVISLSEGTGHLLGTVVQLTDATGLARFGDLRLDQSGAKRLQATSAQQAQANSISFQVTSGAPSGIFVFSGSPQTTTVLQQFPSMLQAQVKDAGGYPAVGVSVTFSVPASGPSGAFAGSATVSTNGSGVATAPALIANGQAGSFTVTATTAGVSSPAVFVLTNLPQQTSSIIVTPGSLQFASEIGQPAPAGQTVRVTSGTGQILIWNATPSAPWLVALPLSGSTPGPTTVTVDPTGLPAGTYTGNILFTGPGSGTTVLLVTYTISNKPALVIAPPALVFATASNTVVPTAQTLQASSSSRPIQYNVAAQVSTPSGGTWLQVTPGQGTTTGTVTVTTKPTGLANGVYDGSMVFTPAEAGLNQVAVPVTLIVGCGQGGCQSHPTIIAVVNGASFQPGGAPRAIMTIFGTDLSDAIYNATTSTLPTQLGPTSVMVNGVPAPLFYASPSQINFQMPSSVSTTNVLVTVTNAATSDLRAARSSPSHGATLTTVDPGLFVTPDLRAAALNGDLSVHTPATPIAAGGYVILYLTGEGSVSPPVGDGVAAPPSPLSLITGDVHVAVGGKAAQVTYQGVAPGFAGLAQLNVIVPSGLTPGNQVVFVTINGVPSNTGLITVR